MTVLQTIIEDLRSRISDKAAPNDYVQGQEIAYEKAADFIESLLPAEEQQIRDAFEEGMKLDHPNDLGNFNKDWYRKQRSETYLTHLQTK